MKLDTTATALIVLCVMVAIPMGAAATSSQQGSAYAGTNVSFDAQSNAIANYSVDGQTVASSIKVQSADGGDEGSVIGGIDVGTNVSALASIDGAALTMGATAGASVRVSADSGAEISAHDNERGIMVIEAGNSEQVVTVNVSANAQSAGENNDTVVVSSDSGTETSYLVVGEGNVSVNSHGNVSAELGQDARLVSRTYTDGRDDDDESQERLITSGTAAAEVYLTQSAESGSETTVDVVNYGQGTAVDVHEHANGTVNMTVSRSQEEGRVVITTVSEQAFGAFEDLNVTVDGEAAAEASTYSELEAATQDGATSKYMVRQDATASAKADVLVALNHFSDRTVEMSSDGDTSGSGPGFGPFVTVVGALVALGGLHRYRQ